MPPQADQLVETEFASASVDKKEKRQNFCGLVLEAPLVTSTRTANSFFMLLIAISNGSPDQSINHTFYDLLLTPHAVDHRIAA